MPINESSATALVRFTGLGIICFNKDRKRGEIGAIRDDKHKLTVKIQKPVFKEGVEKDIIVYQDIATYENLPKDDVQVEIKAAGKPAIEGYETYQSGDFDRLASCDINDFRWIVNMNALHGETALAPTAAGKHPLAKIYIGNGLFYAHKLDRDLFFERVEKDASGTLLQRETFGNVAETIGVKIEADGVIFTIRIAGKEETHLLPRVAGLPYRIEIKNMDPNGDAVYSDMPDYYQYLSSPAGNQFDLNPIIEEPADKTLVADSVDQKVFCHPIGSDDLSSIDDL
jgi:hypothetical protein